MNKSKRPRCRKQSVNNTKQITKICENKEERVKNKVDFGAHLYKGS